MNRRALLLTAAAAAASAAGPALAHHSFAMFEREKRVMFQGVVTEFQFTNPHAWIHIRTPEGKEWSIESGSPNMMRRHGWSSSTLKIGDKVGAVIRPMKDGSPAGTLVSMTLSDGRVLGPGGGPPPPTGNAPRPQ